MERLTRMETSQKIIYTLGHTRWTFDKRDHSRLQDVLDWLFEYQALGPVEELAALVKARDEGQAVVRFATGDTVWIIERDEAGEPCDVSGYVFLTETAGYAFVSPAINGSSDVEDILADAVERTAWDYRADLGVYPITDCYKTRTEAEAALSSQEGGTHETDSF